MKGRRGESGVVLRVTSLPNDGGGLPLRQKAGRQSCVGHWPPFAPVISPEKAMVKMMMAGNAKRR